MKPFNLEEAKMGKPVCTRDGRDARIICYDRRYELPIVALIDEYHHEEIRYYTLNGLLYPYKEAIESKYDLFMKGTRKEGWINIYKDSLHTFTDKEIYRKKEYAVAHSKTVIYDLVDTIKIEWEE